ncbi:hypothetical protein BaRGS_00005294 [Batillaria attramentaria]|uniref:Laminin EGF-like domain-containing protein n=1 Tax=Batillaria attramentaria TaxID=370345 RepID=A0ABD0LW93_9CAEN
MQLNCLFELRCDFKCIHKHCLYLTTDQCDAGRYGNDCSLQCRASGCKNGQCDVVTGLCTQCDGNYGGSHCTDCARGFYGGSCDQSCSAGCPNSECDQQTGHCQPCNSSYWGDRCDKQCPSGCLTSQCDQQTGRCSSCESGYWGDKCDQQCSTGCQNSQCDQQTGYCQSCRSGYWGDFCNETCLSTRCRNNYCDKADGLCSQCRGPNFQLPYCECKDGYYYDDPYCRRCPGQCYNNTPCNKTTGHCDSCAPGRRGATCNEACHVGSYGQDCNEKCGQCASGETTCDPVNGACVNCKPRWLKPQCKVCVDGKYGENCSQTCGQCKDGAICDKETGHCLSCPAGLQPPLCQTNCTGNTYGEGCSKTCGSCFSGAACNTVTGECPGGCASGYAGSLCSETAAPGATDENRGSEALIGPIVGAIIGGMVFIGISIMVGWWQIQTPLSITLTRSSFFLSNSWIRRRHQLSTKDRSGGNVDVEMKPANFPEASADEPKQSDANTDEAAYSEIMDTPNVVLVDVTQKDDDDTSESGHYYSPLDGPRGERSVYTKPVFKDVPAASDNQDYANAEVSQSQVYVNTSVRDNSP